MNVSYFEILYSSLFNVAHFLSDTKITDIKETKVETDKLQKIEKYHVYLKTDLLNIA